MADARFSRVMCSHVCRFESSCVHKYNGSDQLTRCNDSLYTKPLKKQLLGAAAAGVAVPPSVAGAKSCAHGPC